MGHCLCVSEHKACGAPLIPEGKVDIRINHKKKFTHKKILASKVKWNTMLINKKG